MKTNPYQSLYPQLEKMDLATWAEQLQTLIPEKLASEGNHGKMEQWQTTLDAMPQIGEVTVEIKDHVEISAKQALTAGDKAQLVEQLKVFHPWRKGPYRLLDIDIDTEWRSDWKWDRVLPHIQPLKGRKVLDIGGGNGYHGWRMLGEEAELVIGIDPTLVFVMQYHVMSRFIGDASHYVLPIGIEDLPNKLACFDTVFSMGVLYHRRSPIDHLYELRACLRAGGELVLETLVIEGKQGEVLMPEGRYAKMRNVWFFPTVDTMIVWLKRCGFKNVQCVDVEVTRLDEQRSTQWMTFESLTDFLDPDDKTKTIEGHPAPRRAVFTAIAP